MRFPALVLGCVLAAGLCSSASADDVPLAGSCARPVRDAVGRHADGVAGRPLTLDLDEPYLTWYPDCDVPGDPMSATVDWGDGSSSAATVRYDPAQPSSYEVAAQHVYEHATVVRPGDAAGGYIVIVTLRNERTGMTRDDSRYAAIFPAPPARARAKHKPKPGRHRRHRAPRVAAR